MFTPLSTQQKKSSCSNKGKSACRRRNCSSCGFYFVWTQYSISVKYLSMSPKNIMQMFYHLSQFVKACKKRSNATSYWLWELINTPTITTRQCSSFQLPGGPHHRTFNLMYKVDCEEYKRKACSYILKLCRAKGNKKRVVKKEVTFFPIATKVSSIRVAIWIRGRILFLEAEVSEPGTGIRQKRNEGCSIT